MTTPITFLRGLTWDHPRGYRPLEEASRRYKAAYGMAVQWDRRSLASFGNTPIDVLADDYDLLILDHPHVGIAARTSRLLPFDDLLAAEILSELAAQSAGPSHSSYTYDGRQWALAVDAAVQVSSVRQDLLPAAVPLPARWKDVPRFAAALRASEAVMGIPLCPGDAVCCFLTLCASLGRPIGANGRFPLEVAGQALGFLRELGWLAHPECIDWNPIDLYEAMSSGDRIAYCPMAFGYSNYARPSYRSKTVKFQDLPVPRRGLLGGAGIAVTDACKEPAEAARFAAWVSSGEIQSGVYTEAGGQPGNVVAWRDERCNALASGYFAGTLATLEQAYVRPRDAAFVSWQVHAGHRIHGFLRAEGEKVDACARDLQRTFEARSAGADG